MLGLGAGIAAVALVQRDDGDDLAFLTDDRASVVELPFSAPPGSSGDEVALIPSPTFAPIDDPAHALTAFLDAHRRGDVQRSYALLVADDHEQFPSLARWQAARHAMAEVTSFGAFEQEGRSDMSVTFHVDLALRARLDEIAGVVPARATGTFVVRRVGEGDWRIAFSESSLTPHYPNDSGAREAVIAWADARRRCERGAEWEGGLLGVAAEEHAESLCATGDPVSVGQPVPLDRVSGAEPVLGAFGPEASIWARVVPLSGPIDLDVITAPLGEEWVVVGVVQASNGGSIGPP